MRRCVAVFLIALVVLAEPAAALATAYGPLIYQMRLTITGFGLATVCEQAGTLDTAVNFGFTETFNNGGLFTCTGNTMSLPSGYHGLVVDGWVNGGWCGTSSPRYSSTAGYWFTYYAPLCANPPGLQAFHTVVTAGTFTGGGFMWGTTTLSPPQNY